MVSAVATSWDKYALNSSWRNLIARLTNSARPRQVQAECLKAGLLTNRTNFLVSAPTNAGKSLIGTLALLEAIKSGRRARVAGNGEGASDCDRSLQGCVNTGTNSQR